MRAEHVRHHFWIRRVHNRLPDTGTDWVIFSPGNWTPLVNIDHNTPFLIFCHRGSKGGACEVSKATVRYAGFLAKVGTGKTIEKYRKGRIIYAQGEEADKIFYIQSGKIKVNKFRKLGFISYNGNIEVHRSLLMRPAR
jgi:hypothetical protein